MKELKPIEWKEFIIKDLFDISKGLRFIAEDRISGNIPYYSASQKNNALTDMVGNPLFVDKDAIIYTTFGDCFYIEGEFTASDEMSILHNKNLNKYTGLFISNLISLNKYKYAFGRKAFQNKFINETIYLPIQKNIDNSPKIDKTYKYNKKGYLPDWNFMEEYMKSIETKSSIENTISLLESEDASFISWFNENINIEDFKKYLSKNKNTDDINGLSLSNKKWNTFTIDYLFTIQSSCKKFNKSDVEIVPIQEKGYYPYIVRTQKNNGQDGFIKEDPQFLNPANTFSFGQDTSTIFFQTQPYFTGDKVKIFIFKDKSVALNEYIVIFLLNQIRQAFEFFAWGQNSFSEKQLLNTKITLPINENNEPDWKFIEKYMKQIENKLI